MTTSHKVKCIVFSNITYYFIMVLSIIIFYLDIADGHFTFKCVVFVIVNYYFLLRHNRWDVLLFSAWCLLLSLSRIIFHLDITDGTCYV